MIRPVSSTIGQLSHPSLSKAVLILKHSRASAASLVNIFDAEIKRRGGKRGATTDGEQDLLRAMLVLAAAGIDAIAKQLVSDCMPFLLPKDKRVEQGLESFIARRMRSDDEGSLNHKLLAKILVAPDLRAALIAEYVNDLTSSSLQSSEELIKVSYALGMEPNECGITRDALRPVFSARNNIIHELDINFDAPRRRRHVRKKEDMLKYANIIIAIGEKLILGVSQKIS